MTKQFGFTLVEVIIVVALITTLSVISTALTGRAFANHQLELAEDGLIEVLRRAQLRTMYGESDDMWSVRIDSTSYTLFKGATYGSRDTNYDEVHTLSGQLSISNSGGNTIRFDFGNGDAASGAQTLTITDENTSRTVAVTINAIGTISTL
ncbi:MAG: prepilin-type N-terminal cleavage/methylation domain-containing protein [bacterium]|nr:prepilin-type N-terminal cleavage/methylation domain-containing protein [bacterium]MDA1024400.1 prepilin-type N-terminal cleavage/methylation domain-containing protein [bacterium]